MTHSGRWMDFLGACVMREIEYPHAIIYAEIDGSATHAAAGRWRNAMRQIYGALWNSHGR